MSDINWKGGAVCYGDGKQLTAMFSSIVLNDINHYNVSFESALNAKDFKLNEIREGDFIPASELDTEQKYNEVVEVFGLFGFEKSKDSLSYSNLAVGATHFLASKDYGVDSVSTSDAFKGYCKGRQLTYHQIIAIGKLKRMMLERERSNEIPDNTSEFDAIVSSKSVGMSKPKKGLNVIMTNNTAAIKVLEALGLDASFWQSVSINGKEVFSTENADDITTVTVSKYVKKT